MLYHTYILCIRINKLIYVIIIIIYITIINKIKIKITDITAVLLRSYFFSTHNLLKCGFIKNYKRQEYDTKISSININKYIMYFYIINITHTHIIS